MGWGFRRSKSFGPLRINLSKSGIGYSFGVRGARVGVNAKGKKYFRAGIPGTGIFYQSSLSNNRPQTGRLSPAPPQLQPSGSTGLSRGALLVVLLAIGLIGALVFSPSNPPVAPAITPAAAAAPVIAKAQQKAHKKAHSHYKAKPVVTPQAPESGETTPDTGTAQQR